MEIDNIKKLKSNNRLNTTIKPQQFLKATTGGIETTNILQGDVKINNKKLRQKSITNVSKIKFVEINIESEKQLMFTTQQKKSKDLINFVDKTEEVKSKKNYF